MRCGGWVSRMGLGCLALTIAGGCVSLNDHRRLQAAHRTLQADKEAIAQELYDSRNVGDSLRTRVTSLERERDTNAELLANLRKENELLDQMRKTAQSSLEDMAGRQTLGDISIAGPKLPPALDSALKRFADEYPSAVQYDAQRGTVKWTADLLFALGSDVIKASSMEALRSFTDVIKSPAGADFEAIVVGHTDNVPIVRPETKAKHPSNWHLSANRAIAVAQELQKFGYGPQRLGVMGYGEYRPVAPNSTPGGNSKNRRVEIYLIPKGAIVPSSADAGWRVDGYPAFAFARFAP